MAEVPKSNVIPDTKGQGETRPFTRIEVQTPANSIPTRTDGDVANFDPNDVIGQDTVREAEAIAAIRDPAPNGGTPVGPEASAVAEDEDSEDDEKSGNAKEEVEVKVTKIEPEGASEDEQPVALTADEIAEEMKRHPKSPEEVVTDPTRGESGVAPVGKQPMTGEAPAGTETGKDETTTSEPQDDEAKEDVEDEAEVEEDDDDMVDVPRVADHKEDWVNFAVTQGMEKEEAEGHTKDELIELFRDDE